KSRASRFYPKKVEDIKPISCVLHHIVTYFDWIWILNDEVKHDVCDNFLFCTLFYRKNKKIEYTL
ncbi:hypothetical protein, partial [Xenorhabdus sp. NBAII XenSa04]|uniref:hypothetical protein n=1 Tax=Xenorhabdus sp. NBAII XenSa04 TaxID=1429873 RepID=UPI0006490720